MVRLRRGRPLDPRVATPPGVLCPASLSLLSLLLLLLLSLAFSGAAGFGSPAARAALEHVSVVQQPIQHGGDGGAVAEQLSPVFYGPIRRDQRAGSLVASHDDFQQFLGGGQRQLAHSQVVDDEKRHGGEQFHVLLAVAVQCGVCQLFQQDVRFAIEHTIALLDDRVSDGLGTVALAASSWAKKKCVFAPSDPGGGGQVEDQTAVHLWIELEVEVIELLVCVAELRLLVAPVQQALTAAGEFIGDQDGDQVDGGHVLRLCLQQACFQHCGHAAQAQLHQGAIQFDQVHGWFLELDSLLDQVAILGQFADQGIDLPQAQRGLRAALQITAHEPVLGHAQLQRRGAGLVASCTAVLLGQREHAHDAADPEPRPDDDGSRRRRRRCWRRPCGPAPAVEAYPRRRALRTVLIADAMSATLLPQMLAQQLAGARIDQPHVHRVPLHVDLPPDPARRRAVVSSFNFDAAIQMNGALAILVIAERLQRQRLK